MQLTVSPGQALSGTVRVPGDKSISHRAVMLGAIAEGESRIEGFLDSADTAATRRALAAMGVDIEGSGTSVRVRGAGLRGLTAPAAPLDLGNSGTSVRLLAGLLAGQAFDSEMRGDDSLMRRPMERVAEPLRRMGAHIECADGGTLPLRIRGGAELDGIDYAMPAPSAQVKSALLLAGLYARGRTCVTEPAPTRDHTERMLAFLGCPIERRGRRVCLENRPLRGRGLLVPGDISSAAFLMVAAAVTPGSRITLQNVGVNPTRAAVIDVLRAMGADLQIETGPDQSGEPVADITVAHSSLRGIVIPEEQVPVAIDELPVLMIAAAFAEGETALRGASELRVKESDRLAAMQAGLEALGAGVTALADGLVVRGGGLRGGTVDSRGDHRIAMAFAVAGLAAGGAVTVGDCANISTSYPGFAADLRALGADVREAA